ncbi:MAG: efflux transporter outer membrane subunit [Desulfosalsimonadaceae bacterium]
MKRCTTIPILIMVAMAVSGCMKAGPDYERPETEFSVPEAYENAAHTGEYPPGGKWWEAFNDDRLNETVARAAAGNHDIREAAARVMEARALLDQADADRYPQIGAAAQASRRQQTIANPITGRNESVETRQFSLSLPASFEIDLWGRLARASEAGRAELMATELNRRTIIHSIVAETVARYLEIRAIEAQIRITEKMVETSRLHLELVKNRYERGLAPVMELHQAKRALARAQSRLPALRRTAGLRRQALSLLQGAYPDNEDAADQQAYAFQMLDPVPEGLPAALLTRRPDIMAAEARLEAASARIGQAKAARFPRLSLTGAFGYASDSLSSFFTPQNEIWNIAAEGFQPIYDAGKLAAGQRGAEARFHAQSVAYARTVLTAFGEVEGALLTRREQMEQRTHLAIYLEQAALTEKNAENRYRRGLIDYSDFLDALQARYQAQMEMVEIESAIYANRVRLHRALGGGWDIELNPLHP